MACKAYHQEVLDEDGEEDDTSNDDDSVSPKEVGHNIYILCHQLALYNKEIGQLLKVVPNDSKVAEALRYYSSHTAQIEVVRHDRTMEQIVFPIPEVCEYLTEDTKIKILTNAERDDQGSKVTDFFAKSNDMFQEMMWQKKLRSNSALFWVSSHMSFWSYIIFIASVFINIIVASFYPFQEELPSNDHCKYWNVQHVPLKLLHS